MLLLEPPHQVHGPQGHGERPFRLAPRSLQPVEDEGALLRRPAALQIQAAQFPSHDSPHKGGCGQGQGPGGQFPFLGREPSRRRTQEAEEEDRPPVRADAAGRLQHLLLTMTSRHTQQGEHVLGTKFQGLHPNGRTVEETGKERHGAVNEVLEGPVRTGTVVQRGDQPRLGVDRGLGKQGPDGKLGDLQNVQGVHSATGTALPFSVRPSSRNGSSGRIPWAGICRSGCRRRY